VVNPSTTVMTPISIAIWSMHFVMIVPPLMVSLWIVSTDVSVVTLFIFFGETMPSLTGQATINLASLVLPQSVKDAW
jgi:hypothetical protein